MTLHQLNEADEMEQIEAVWEGKHVNTRYDGTHTIQLYKIDDFYVEVYYHKKLNSIRKFEALTEDQLIYFTCKSN